jgi:hypothetical protein
MSGRECCRPAATTVTQPAEREVSEKRGNVRRGMERDENGIPLTAPVSAANVHDSQLMVSLLESARTRRPGLNVTVNEHAAPNT